MQTLEEKAAVLFKLGYANQVEFTSQQSTKRQRDSDNEEVSVGSRWEETRDTERTIATGGRNNRGKEGQYETDEE